jgi:drug/metabolite transporter (DMT)-like permease
MPFASRINFLLFIILACLWSGSFIGIKEVVAVWPPIFGAAVRVSIALLSLMILSLIMGKKTKVSFSLRWKIWVIGLFAQGIPFLFLFWGEQSISPGLAGILNATLPIWAFILALIFLPESTPFSIPKILGLLIGLTGIIIIFWPIVTFEKNISTILGTSAVLIMALSYAIASLLNQHFLQGRAKIDFMANIYHQHWASVTFLIFFSLIFEKWPDFNTLLTVPIPWLASLYLGVMATAVAFLIYYHLIRAWDGVRASSVTYVVPVLTLIWDYLIFDNQPGKYEIMGVIAILCGVVLIQLTNLFYRNKV